MHSNDTFHVGRPISNQVFMRSGVGNFSVIKICINNQI